MSKIYVNNKSMWGAGTGVIDGRWDDAWIQFEYQPPRVVAEQRGDGPPLTPRQMRSLAAWLTARADDAEKTNRR